MKYIIQNKDWEKEFDKNVNFDEAELGSNWSQEDIKDFIRNLISQTKKEVLEEVKEKIRHEGDCSVYDLGTLSATCGHTGCTGTYCSQQLRRNCDCWVKECLASLSIPQKNIQECKQNPQSVTIDKKMSTKRESMQKDSNLGKSGVKRVRG